MIYTILQTLALILTLESAIFLIRGNFFLSAQSIAELSGTYRDFNPRLVQTLSRQNADTQIGAILLILAFLVQIITLWKGPTFDDLGPANHTGLFIGILIAVCVFCASWWGSSSLSTKVSVDVERILRDRINKQLSNND